jgi:CRISPR-associated protein Cmr3
MTRTLSIRPIDVLYLRGNRLFGTTGDFAHANMPPWPSVFAGALRAHILVDKTIGFKDFLEGRVADPEVKAALGSPQSPGSFQLSAVGLRANDSNCYPAPMDLVPPEPQGSHCIRITPSDVLSAQRIRSSYPLAYLPILREEKPSKKKTWWIKEEGLALHLAGKEVHKDYLVDPFESLWELDPRLGIALDPNSRSVETGKIYTTEAIALKPGVSFVVTVHGADRVLPSSGLIRFGGDGRGAEIAPVADKSLPDPLRVPLQGRRFRLILSTPGIFPPGNHDEGWLPPAVFHETGDYILRHPKLTAKLVCAAVPRLEVVSGWDIAEHKPKEAIRVVPAGSVYWFEAENENTEVLEQLRTEGLWPLLHIQRGSVDGFWAARRAEGFNNVWIGNW